MSNPLSEEFMLKIPRRDRATFEFYYAQTAGETLPVSPQYTWDQFAQNGYAVFGESENYTLDTLDMIANDETKKEDEGYAPLIPNYRDRTGEFPAMLDAFKGEPAEVIKRHTDSGKAAIINCSHPSLASPILVARSIVEAIGSESRQQIFIVYGLLPTIFEYKLGEQNLSPVSVARSLGNVMLTAARTPSNETNDDEVENWQQTQRSTFLKIFEEETSPRSNGEKGAIVVLCVTGQRNKLGPVLRPDGSLNYLHGHDVWSVGVDDTLLGPEIASHVWMKVDPNPTHIHRDSDVHTSNRLTCELASHGNTEFTYESRLAHTRRLLAQGAIQKVNIGTKKPKPLHLG